MVYVPSFSRRLIAKIMDSILAGIFCWPLWLQYAKSAIQGEERFFAWKWIFLCSLLYFCYQWFFYRFLGATIGKKMMGLKLVPSANPESELNWMQSFLRVFADCLSIFFGWGLQALMFARFDRTHVSDWVAETRVIQLQARNKPVERRVFLAAILCVYFSLTSFVKAYQFIRVTHYSKDGVIVENSSQFSM